MFTPAFSNSVEAFSKLISCVLNSSFKSAISFSKLLNSFETSDLLPSNSLIFSSTLDCFCNLDSRSSLIVIFLAFNPDSSLFLVSMSSDVDLICSSI